MRFYDYQGRNEVKDETDDCNCENKEGRFRTGNHVAFLNGPGNDHGDDNFSYADGLVKQFSIKSNALVYDSGYAEEMNNLLNGVYCDGIDAAEQLFRASPVLVIPSGGLYGMENNSTFKYVLEEYVRLGGTLVVFAQQYGSHFDKVVPVPEGENLKSYGWREDQSCYNESSYYDSIHPAVTSWVAWGDLGTMQTDGYFDVYPSTSTTILNRSKNRKPLLLSYPVGEGTVILTSMFTDWGAAHSQSSITELRLVRDLVTFARNPRKEILWPANFNATLITRLINNQDSPLPVTLEMSIANDETGEEIFQRTKLDTIPAFGNKTVTDTFNSGVYAAGQYTIRQTLSGPSTDDAREIYVTIEADKSMEISLNIDPITIPSDTPAETTLTLGLSNTGNVPLENEVLMIEVFDKGLEEVVKTEEYLLSLSIAETRTDTKVLPLTLAEGQYEIRLRRRGDGV